MQKDDRGRIFWPFVAQVNSKAVAQIDKFGFGIGIFCAQIFYGNISGIAPEYNPPDCDDQEKGEAFQESAHIVFSPFCGQP